MFLSILISLVVISFGQAASARDEIVNIGDLTTQKLTASTSCKPSDWNSNTTYSCDCCLIKHYLNGYSTDKNIKSCVDEKKYCSNEPLASQSRDEQEKSIREIVDRSLVATELPLKGLPAQLKEADAERLINEAGALRLISDWPKCIKAKAQKIESKHAAQLFVIMTSKKVDEICSEDYQVEYILKGSKEPLKEIENLAIIKDKSVRWKKIPHLDITNPEFSASYVVEKPSLLVKQKRFYVTLLQAAKGKSLRDLIDEAAQELTKNKVAAEALKATNDIKQVGDQSVQKKLETIERAYSILGSVLGQFHRAHQEKCEGGVLCKTVIHGDLHGSNTFFDPETETISFIDNESMAASTNNEADPGNDVVRVYYYAAARGGDAKSRFPSIIPEEVMAKITMEPFLTAYIGAYPPDQQKEVTEKLRDIMLKSAAKLLLSYKAATYQVLNPIKLSGIQNRYVKPFFNRILSNLVLKGY